MIPPYLLRCAIASLLLAYTPSGKASDAVNWAEGRPYSISVGSYFTAEGFGTTLDKDLADPEDPSAGRKMLLTHGKPSQSSTPVIYSFWSAPEQDSFINIELDLDTPRPISEVVVFGVNHTPIYHARSIVVRASEDGLIYEEIGHLEPVEQPETGAWKAVVTLPKSQLRYVQVAVFAREKAHLGIAGIQLNGPAQ